MKYIILIFLYIININYSNASKRLIIPDDYNNDFSCSAKVDHDKSTASFLFELKLNKDSLITWNKKGLKINEAEYSWVIYFESSNIMFDFTNFKKYGKEKNATYNDLFKDGQVSLWRNGANILDYEEPNSPTVQIENGNIILTINNNIEIYKLLFDSKPKYANFWILGGNMNKKPYRCKTIIKKQSLS